ncbi:MAG TPA: Z1 domain-containing protein [Gemmatimonadaceae bacterium]
MTVLKAADTVAVLVPETSAGGWSPKTGYEGEAVLKKVPLDSRDTVRDESLAVLSRCVPPTGPSQQRTGLVVGYVQSGKTLSFTTVAALARDNGFRLVIALTGTSVYLFGQSVGRLTEDLQLNEPGGWKPYQSDEFREQDAKSIQYALKRWEKPLPDDEKQTVIVTVMKEKTHLKALVDLLARLQLDGVPTIVIDDEADQAGLNTKVKRNEESTIYGLLRQVRDLLPNHTFLQYTATPQALLLINLIDSLSPDFAEVLTPGTAYTGGKTFFEQNLQLVREIPGADIPAPGNPLSGPPPSLLEALRQFFIGVAAGMLSGGRKAHGNRSMMIHPSRLTPEHGNYFLWVQVTQRRWEKVLNDKKKGAEYGAEVKQFRTAYDNLASTGATLPPFDEIVEVLSTAVGETQLRVVNRTPLAGKKPGKGINWKRDYAHILVGGTALDRGFTVQGLTVTYMPRGLGVANADTIQQRARWFGYKEQYLGFCRVYLTGDTIAAYKSYVEHEEQVRKSLRAFAVTGKPFQQWKRAFFLDAALRPTRSNVLGLDYVRGNYRGRWFEQTRPYVDNDATKDNRSIIDSIRKDWTWAPDQVPPNHPRRLPAHRHLVAGGLSLAGVIEKFLVPLRVSDPADSLRYTALLLTLERLREECDKKGEQALCDVYLMRPEMKQKSFRTIDGSSGAIKNLFQGAYPDAGGAVYKGDRAVKSANRLTVQIHHLDEVRSDKGVVARDVPVVAIAVPKEWGKDWLIHPK